MDPLTAIQWSLAAAVIAGCVVVWFWVVVRLWRGLAVLPYQPRRRVPWRGIDVLAVLLVYFAVPRLAMVLTISWLDLDVIRAPAAGQGAALRAEHPATTVLESGNVWAIALCVVTVVPVAAVVEEFVFRLLFQGWLEAVENRRLRRMPSLRGMVPGTLAVAISSMLFATAHCRVPMPPLDLYLIVLALAVQTVVSLLTLGFAVVFLRVRSGATLEDFGVVPQRFSGDVKLGLLAFLAVTPLVYLVYLIVRPWLSPTVVADPIPILVLAFALGIVYYRTHRILPAIVFHMGFNSLAVIMVLTSVGK